MARGDRAVVSGSRNVEPYDLLKRRVAPGSRQKALTPLHPRRILSRSCPGIGAILMDRFATPSECWQQAALCRARADAAADERLRAAWISIDADLDEARCTQGTASALECLGEVK